MWNKTVGELAANASQFKVNSVQDKNVPQAANTISDVLSPAIKHPLDPLTIHEINLTKDLVRKFTTFQKYMHFDEIILDAPEDENYVLNYKPNDPLQRRATATIHDPKQRTIYVAVVDLIKQSVESFEDLNTVQFNKSPEIIEAENVLRTNESLLAALAKRKIKMDDVYFWPSSLANRHEHNSPSKRRIYRPYAAVKKSKGDGDDHGYIDGLVIKINLDNFKVDVEDHLVD